MSSFKRTFQNINQCFEKFAKFCYIPRSKIKKVQDSTNEIRSRKYRHDLMLGSSEQLIMENIKKMVLLNRVIIIIIVIIIKQRAIVNACKQHQIPSKVVSAKTLILEDEIRSTHKGLAILTSEIY